ncbi:3-deoxy-7-phosphoheptulonate synthase [Streptomyces sp. NPDC003077]|uniref:3-deoxy-7-phosphoheptulonate synthase n=1 Tax=Streptomyces sp. NPDC003077 TaxID=3154443 RepID=UPI0033B41911
MTSPAESSAPTTTRYPSRPEPGPAPRPRPGRTGVTAPSGPAETGEIEVDAYLADVRPAAPHPYAAERARHTVRDTQQPPWQDHPALGPVKDRLAASVPLVTSEEVRELRGALAAVARGRATVLQAGDCAESLYECTPAHARQRADTLDRLGDHLQRGSGRTVVRIGRMAGQFAKPRSRPTERVGGLELPAFRGHLVNSEAPTEDARRADPYRMLQARLAAATVGGVLREARAARAARPGTAAHTGPWTSHEALVLDYETPLVRTDPSTGGRLLTSTHFPWVGERTRQPGSPNVALLADIDNPVGCKIGPGTTPDEVLQLCQTLDPERTPGRLTLIVRMGRTRISEALPPIVATVRRAGHPVVWLCDPMHGNTTTAGDGRKTRYLADLIAEAAAFRSVLERQGQHPGGVHLEVAAGEVTECVGGPIHSEDQLGHRYTTLCDPRLNPEQAERFLNTWA